MFRRLHSKNLMKYTTIGSENGYFSILGVIYIKFNLQLFNTLEMILICLLLGVYPK